MSFLQLRSSKAEREHIRYFLTLATFYDNTCVSESIVSSYTTTDPVPPQQMLIFSSGGTWDHCKYHQVVLPISYSSRVQSIGSANQNTSFSLVLSLCVPSELGGMFDESRWA